MLSWNQQKKWYWKNEAIDLLTEKNDSNSLELCDNLNLHYNWLFLVKIYHFSAYRVTEVCQKKKKKIDIESDAVKRLLSEIFFKSCSWKKKKKITSICFVLQI